MVKIKFPDGNVKEFESGVTGMDIAKSISHKLAKEVLSISVNGVTWDLTRGITTDSEIKLYTWDDEEGRHAFWHSSAHLMAEALQAIYPNIKFGIGPAIENGFYYDVDPGEGVAIQEKDLAEIEKKMLELARKNEEYCMIDAVSYTHLSCPNPLPVRLSAGKREECPWEGLSRIGLSPRKLSLPRDNWHQGCISSSGIRKRGTFLIWRIY